MYAGSSLEVKIETDSNDAMEIKTEADSNDITEYPRDDGPSIGMCGLFGIYIIFDLLAARTNSHVSVHQWNL